MRARRLIDRETYKERDRQDAKWGDQSTTRDGVGANTYPLAVRPDHISLGYDLQHVRAERLALWFTSTTDQDMDNGGASMANILLEEVFEALAEDDLEGLKTELIQVRAVVTAWLEYLLIRGRL